MSKRVFLQVMCIAVGCACACMSGCGYTTRGFRYSEDRIYISPVVNKVDITSEKRRFSDYRTFPILLEKKLTNEIISSFNIDGHLRATNQEQGALVLRCTIKDYRKNTLRYTSSDDVKEQRLRLHVHMQLLDSKGELVKDRKVIGEAEFFLSGPNRKSESQAQNELIDDTARRIVETVVEEW